MSEKKLFALSSIAEFENDGDDLDRIYIPGRGYVLGISHGENMVILPEAPSLRTFTTEMEQILHSLNLKGPQTVFMPDNNYLLDVTIQENLDLLRQTLSREMAYKVMPYSRTFELDKWITSLRQEGYQVRTDMLPRVYFDNLTSFQHRGGWGRQISTPSASGFAEKYNLPYPKAWVGQGLSQIIEAYERVVWETGQTEAVFKPIFSSGGFTLARVNSAQEVVRHYERLQATGSLTLFDQEIPVEMQQAVALKDLFSIQYSGQQNIAPGGLTRQLEKENRWQGNIFNSNHIAPKVRQQAEAIFTNFQHGAAKELGELLRGFGGLDLATVHGSEQVYVLEHNGGREVGARPGIALAHSFGIDDRPYMIPKVSGTPLSSVLEAWRLLQAEGIGYQNETQSGVLPMLWVDGNVFLFVAGEDQKDHSNLEQLAEGAIELATREGLLSLAG